MREDNDPQIVGSKEADCTHLFLIRHAPVYSRGKMYGGLTDLDCEVSPTDPQVRWLAEELERRGEGNPIRMFASELTRAKKTALAVFDAGNHRRLHPPTFDARLNEQSFGELEGQPFTEMMQTWGGGVWARLYARTTTRAGALAMGGSEPAEEVHQRGQSFLRSVLYGTPEGVLTSRESIANRTRGLRLAIVGHRCALRILATGVLIRDNAALCSQERLKGWRHTSPFYWRVVESLAMDNLSLSHIVCYGTPGMYFDPSPAVLRTLNLTGEAS